MIKCIISTKQSKLILEISDYPEKPSFQKQTADNDLFAPTYEQAIEDIQFMKQTIKRLLRRKVSFAKRIRLNQIWNQLIYLEQRFLRKHFE